MSAITLSKRETKLLVEAAGRGGNLEFSDAIKPATRSRLIGRFERDSLIVAGEAGHELTPAGYRALGLRPPRLGRKGSPSVEAPRGNKQALVLDLLGRGEGASIDELVSATGWLPHTTRAALSRLRSAGRPLAKSTREDGRTVYKIVPEEPVAPKRVRARAKQPDQAEAAPV
ncbi:DUF3489 domain-containing protein [Micromonospora sp. STR1s_5]|nr:DUF3489 domain-containing protein [Micromonospora sp. STR1s_5]